MQAPIDLNTEGFFTALELEAPDPISRITTSWIQQAAIRSALRDGNEVAAVRFAVLSGMRDENKLTDVVFYTRYPQQLGKTLRRGNPLVQNWLEIRDRIVRPALRASSAPAAPPAPATPAAPGQAQATARPPSTTSGVEAAGNTARIMQCILGLQDRGRSISFVVRYLRDLKRPEAAALSTAGLKIVSCYESRSAAGLSPTNMAYFTRAQGQHDGRLGFSQAQAVGQPARAPVYFAVDTEPSTKQRQAILDYFQGVQEGYKQYLAGTQTPNKPRVPYAIGVYGPSCVLSSCQAQGITTWYWQAFAPGWCSNLNRRIWPDANIHTSGLDKPTRCGWRLGRLEGWGNEGGWMVQP